MLLASLFAFYLARSYAYPTLGIPDKSIIPLSPILDIFVVDNTSECIRDPTKYRSTWQLVYNCLGTIAVCTYVAIHPNLPDRSASFWTKLWQKIVTTTYAVFAPELIIMWAMRQRFAASRIAKHFQAYRWTKTHAFFVQMGGLVCHDGKGYQVVTIDEEGCVCLGEGKGIVTNIIFPIITEEELLYKAKGNFLSKAIVVLQTSWFVLQCIARHAQGLVVTELELVTLAFATLNIITYFLWWNKPLNAAYPIYFQKNGNRLSGPPRKAADNVWESESYWALWFSSKEDEPEQTLWERMMEDINKRSVWKTIWKRVILAPFRLFGYPVWELIEGGSIPSPTSVGAYYAGPLPFKDMTVMVGHGSSFVGIVFGAIHLLGWNLDFHTTPERILWRASSIVVTAEFALTGLAFLLSYADHMAYEGWRGRVVDKVWRSTAFIAMGTSVAYVLARLALLVQAGLALRNLPPSAHVNIDWFVYIPHI